MNIFSGINYLAVVVATVVYYFIGFAWYTLLFGKIWQNETGVNMTSTARPQALSMAGQFISTFLYALGIAVVLKLYGNSGIISGIIISALVTVVFVIPINSGNLFFTGKKKLFLLDVSERAIGSLVLGIILGAWN